MTETGGAAAVHASGGCACGGVRYEVTTTLRPVANCHCEPCRRITGHFMAATAAPTEAIRMTADDSLRWYQRTETVRYGFCSMCGATLFWQADDKPEHLSIAAGTLDTPTGIATTVAIYTADASDYHVLDDTIENVAEDRTDAIPYGA